MRGVELPGLETMTRLNDHGEEQASTNPAFCNYPLFHQLSPNGPWHGGAGAH